MKTDRLKVVVSITEVYPTLQAALHRVPEARRSERLRILAFQGLQVEGGSFAVSPAGVTENVSRVSGDSGINADELRCVVILNAALPRLFAEIESTPSRYRAERMRALALIGLQIESGRLVTVGGAPLAVNTEAPLAVQATGGAPKPKPPTPEPAPIADLKSDLQAPLRETEPEGSAPPPSVVKQAVGDTKDADAVGKKVRNFARSLGGLG